MKDLMGKAIWDYYHHNSPEDIHTETSISENDLLPIAHLFRDFKDMNPIEQKALELVNGKVLDVGAAAGPHTLFLQDLRKLDVTALDVSPKSIEVCKLRGVKNAVCTSILDFEGEKFDTILLLMNGTGIFKTFDKISIYLEKLHSLLNEKGQILIDGTDLIYMYTHKNGPDLPIERYYGEVDYYLTYKGEKENPMTWLYLDYGSLKQFARIQGFQTEMILRDGHAYLAQLIKN